MFPTELKELKANALALRNIASKVLEMVERVEKKPALSSGKRINKKQVMASDLIERIHTGRRKPLCKS